MRLISSRLSAFILVVALSIGVASPAFALPREGRERDNPIVRVIKQLLHKFGITPLEEAGVPHP